MFGKKSKKNKVQHNQYEYYLCALIILCQVAFVIWDRIDAKRQ